MIGPKCVRASAAVVIFLCVSSLVYADRTADMRALISYIATALTAANPADAMTPFDKSFADYEKLSNYFQGLNAFQVQNEVNIVDEQDTDTETKLTVDWTMTLTDLGSNSTEQRSAEIHVRLVPKKGKWAIVDFSPIGIFNPQQKAQSGR